MRQEWDLTLQIHANLQRRWGEDDETHESQKLGVTCLPSFDCNADSEGPGGTTERIFAMPSAQKAIETNKKM
jgi:hypothetical protein